MAERIGFDRFGCQLWKGAPLATPVWRVGCVDDTAVGTSGQQPSIGRCGGHQDIAVAVDKTARIATAQVRAARRELEARHLLTCVAMRSAAIVIVLSCGVAHGETGFIQEGALGIARADGLLSTDDGGFAVRGAFGLRRGVWGGELFFQSAALGHDDTGHYNALSFGPMLTARHVFACTQMDSVFSRWFELYGRAGPTYSFVLGDPGERPLDGASGLGFAAGGGMRFVVGAIGLALDITLVRIRAHAAATEERIDEQRTPTVPGVDVTGNVVTTTFGFSFVL